MSPRTSLIISSLLGASAVGLGAFGAHALRARLLESGMSSTWDTAVKYHLVHAATFFAVSLFLGADSPTFRTLWLARAAACWLLGVILFSGSLYAFALGGPHSLVFVTPLGGLALLAGWLLLIFAARPPTSR